MGGTLPDLARQLSERSTLAFQQAEARLLLVEKRCGSFDAIPLDILTQPAMDLALSIAELWEPVMVSTAYPPERPPVLPTLAEIIAADKRRWHADSYAAQRERTPDRKPSRPELLAKQRAKRKSRAKLAKKSKRRNRQ